MHDRPPLISAERCPPLDFFSLGLIWNRSLIPWYHVNVRILYHNRFDDRALMVPSFHRLKDILNRQDDFFRIESIDYVTPGYMNESGHWKMEPLLEISELFNAGGWSIPRCRVGDSRVYRELKLERPSEWGNEQLLYRREI